MKITNKFNLPKPFCEAVSIDTYSKGDSDYSTTGLLRPARMVALERNHWDELEQDVSDMVWRMSGQVKHVVLERIAMANPDYVVEKRFSTVIDGKKISGQLDLYDPGTKTLYDWKETSVWKQIVGNTDDWVKQSNINRYILAQNDIQVDSISNIVFFKDWKRREKGKENYPQSSIMEVKLEMWDLEKTLAFLKERIKAHETAKENLPVCTQEETWARPAQWALIKKGGKRASKVCDSEEEALRLKKPDQEIEYRPAEYVRCEDYCLCAEFCSQFKQMKGE